ncbi:GFA family protein [Acinetobacter higginsii]|uniref:GFA family protein n=1 Tax=Acinetobacter higginsii TaxID=70347 RepID=UPI001F4AB548|nr:GFA family protein [Acinetobacter higginsii]MCH7295162.1 GFA family protein [Acinetobacter higginsii]MCI3878608.1 GFA family protein [Acinetobacter higginsii]
MPNEYKGSCLCGAVSYQAQVAPRYRFNCHCRDCQKATGSAYAPIAFFHQSELKITGELKYFESLGLSGKPIRRAFCPNCGSQMFGLPELVPEMISIRAGTLDDPNLYQPQAECFVSHANEWDLLNPNISHFEKMMGKKRE